MTSLMPQNALNTMTGAKNKVFTYEAELTPTGSKYGVTHGVTLQRSALSYLDKLSREDLARRYPKVKYNPVRRFSDENWQQLAKAIRNYIRLVGGICTSNTANYKRHVLNLYRFGNEAVIVELNNDSSQTFHDFQGFFDWFNKNVK